MNCKIKILGHRGAKAEVLENSKEGFIQAHRLIKEGIDGIEFDVQITSDNQLVLAHDNTLARVCRQQGMIEQLTADYCKKVFFVNTGHRMLTLTEIVPYLYGYNHIELEIKTHPRMDKRKMVNILYQNFCNSELFKLPIVLTSFDIQLLELLKNHKGFREFSRGLLVLSTFKKADLVNSLLRIQAKSVGLKYMLITEEIVSLCHRYGIQVTAWTVNNLKVANRLIDIGVDTIITDNPTLFLKEYG